MKRKSSEELGGGEKRRKKLRSIEKGFADVDGEF